MTDMAGALGRYAARFHARLGTGHHVASPLGAWLLLALCGPASHGPTRDQLTDVLGCDIDTAAAAAGELLNPPHAHVASAAAVWNRPQAISDAFAQWQTRLPAAVTTGDLESQGQLDTWAKENTLGLIDTFPIKLSPEILLVLATALATRVSWEEPFAVVPASRLGATSAWAQQLHGVLHTPGKRGHASSIVATEQAGDVAVHTAQARDGLSATAGRSARSSICPSAEDRSGHSPSIPPPPRRGTAARSGSPPSCPPGRCIASMTSAPGPGLPGRRRATVMPRPDLGLRRLLGRSCRGRAGGAQAEGRTRRRVRRPTVGRPLETYRN